MARHYRPGGSLRWRARRPLAARRLMIFLRAGSGAPGSGGRQAIRQPDASGAVKIGCPVARLQVDGVADPF